MRSNIYLKIHCGTKDKLHFSLKVVTPAESALCQQTQTRVLLKRWQQSGPMSFPEASHHLAVSFRMSSYCWPSFHSFLFHVVVLYFLYGSTNPLFLFFFFWLKPSVDKQLNYLKSYGFDDPPFTVTFDMILCYHCVVTEQEDDCQKQWLDHSLPFSLTFATRNALSCQAVASWEKWSQTRSSFCGMDKHAQISRWDTPFFPTGGYQPECDY